MLLEPGGAVYPSGRTFPEPRRRPRARLCRALLARTTPGRAGTGSIGDDPARARDADWVSGAGFLVRRGAFEAVGGFDEAYFMYVEDVDLCWRLHRAGWAVLYEPSARVVHEQGLFHLAHPYRMLAAHHRSILALRPPLDLGRERLFCRWSPSALCRPVRARDLGALLGALRSRDTPGRRSRGRSGEGPEAPGDSGSPRTRWASSWD